MVIGTDCIGINYWPQGHWFQIFCGPKMKVRSNGKFLNIISEEPGMEIKCNCILHETINLLYTASDAGLCETFSYHQQVNILLLMYLF